MRHSKAGNPHGRRARAEGIVCGSAVSGELRLTSGAWRVTVCRL